MTEQEQSTVGQSTVPVLHLRKDGETSYIELSKLHGNISTASTDAEIRSEVERHLDLPDGQLNDFVVERLGNDISVRPQAVYG